MDEILSANQPQMDRVCDKVKKLLIKNKNLSKIHSLKLRLAYFLAIIAMPSIKHCYKANK